MSLEDQQEYIKKLEDTIEQLMGIKRDITFPFKEGFYFYGTNIVKIMRLTKHQLFECWYFRENPISVKYVLDRNEQYKQSCEAWTGVFDNIDQDMVLKHANLLENLEKYIWLVYDINGGSVIHFCEYNNSYWVPIIVPPFVNLHANQQRQKEKV